MEIIKDKCVTKDLEDDEIIENETSKIQCLFTPGHCEDHMCYLLYPQSEDEPYVIFSGDCVLGTPSGKFEELYDYMESLYRIQSLCEKYPNLQICVGHSIDLEKEYIIMDAKSKIDDYIATRLEREEQIISAIRSDVSEESKVSSSGVPKSEVYSKVYGPRNLNASLKVAAMGQIDHHVSKLVKDGLLEVIEGEDPIYRLLDKD